MWALPCTMFLALISMDIREAVEPLIIRVDIQTLFWGPKWYNRSISRTTCELTQIWYAQGLRLWKKIGTKRSRFYVFLAWLRIRLVSVPTIILKSKIKLRVSRCRSTPKPDTHYSDTNPLKTFYAKSKFPIGCILTLLTLWPHQISSILFINQTSVNKGI